MVSLKLLGIYWTIEFFVNQGVSTWEKVSLEFYLIVMYLISQKGIEAVVKFLDSLPHLFNQWLA